MKHLYRIAFAVFALCAVRAAQGEVMLWWVNSNPVSGTNPGGESVSMAWDYAMLRATTATTAEQAIYSGGGSITETDDDTIGTAGNEIIPSYDLNGSNEATEYLIDSSHFGDPNNTYAIADLSALGVDTTALYFYIELYDANDVLVGFSTAQSYSDLQSFRHTSHFEADWDQSNAWSPTAWTIVPEPSSGLMMLLGLAVVGLRRKRS